MLVAGAAMSLLAPVAAQASNVNLDDMKSYSNSSKSEGFTNNYLNIEPGDFIHQSINDLANSRGCSVDISNRSITRYEAASIVNSCLGDVAEVSTVERSLIDEFSSELALIRGRIDGIEARLNEFEAGAFSSTTTLDGYAAFALHAVDGGDKISADEKTHFSYAYQMNLNSSFTGDDNLYVRLKSKAGWDGLGNKPGSYHNLPGGGTNYLAVDKIWYTFPIGDQFTATIGPKIENYYMLAASPSIYKPKLLKAFRFGGHASAFGASTSTGLGVKYDAGNGFASSVTVNSKGAESASGFLTDEDVNKVNVMAAYTADNYHLSATYTSQKGQFGAFHYYSTGGTFNAASNGADGVALRGWWRPDETGTAIPSVSVGYDVMTFDPTAGFTEGYGYAVSLNWSDIFQADDTIGVSFGQPIKGTEHTDGTTKDVDPFIWELYYSFKPNDSIEVIPGVFGGSDVDTATNQDLFGAVLTTVFKF